MYLPEGGAFLAEGISSARPWANVSLVTFKWGSDII